MRINTPLQDRVTASISARPHATGVRRLAQLPPSASPRARNSTSTPSAGAVSSNSGVRPRRRSTTRSRGLPSARARTAGILRYSGATSLPAGVPAQGRRRAPDEPVVVRLFSDVDLFSGASRRSSRRAAAPRSYRATRSRAGPESARNFGAGFVDVGHRKRDHVCARESPRTCLACERRAILDFKRRTDDGALDRFARLAPPHCAALAAAMTSARRRCQFSAVAVPTSESIIAVRVSSGDDEVASGPRHSWCVPATPQGAIATPRATGERDPARLYASFQCHRPLLFHPVHVPCCPIFRGCSPQYTRARGRIKSTEKPPADRNGAPASDRWTSRRRFTCR